MKKLSILLASLLVSSSEAAMYFSNSISYGTGTLGSVGSGDGWSGSNSGVTVATNSLDGDSLGLVASAGNKITCTTSSSAGTYNQFSTGILNSSVYYSFLLKINSTTGLDTTGKVITGLLRQGSASSYYADVWLRLNGANVEIGLSKLRAGTTWHGTPLVVGNTYLVVVKYQFVGGSGNDGVALWLNPVPGGSEPSASIAFSTGGDGNDSTGIGRCYVYGGTTVSVDELRIASTWAEAVPSSGTPPAPVGPPRITQAIRSGGDMVLRGTNGPPNGPYDVLSATSLSLALNLWPGISSGAFDGAGNFASTNPVSPSEAQRFYVIRSGTNTSPPVPEAPQITDQPESLALTEGQDAAFNIAVTGTAPLFYQWFFNTNTAIANATNATYGISSVTLGNAGGYSVVVANAGGSATSVVAMLAVSVPPPAPPVITGQPQSIIVTEGAGAGFGVAVTGSAPLIYQWFFNTNTPLANGTNATYVIASATTNDAGVYSVFITNAIGATNSSFATLTVLPPASNTGPFQILQAEDAAFTGKTDTQHSGYTGSGFVDTDNATGAYVEWEFGRQTAGTETVVFRYAHGKTDNRTASLAVNGVVVNGALAFPPTGAFTTWQAVTNTIPVVVGRNTLRLTALNSPGLANMDRADVTGDPQFRLTTLVSGRGSVSLAPSNAFGYFNPGTLVTLAAVPQTNATFTGWSGALTGTNNPQSLTVASNTSVTATFQSLQAFTLYVATNGSDANPGTVDAPFLTLHAAVASAFAGDVIFLRGGTHYYTSTVNLTGQNSSNNPVLITAYPGESAELNWSNWTPASETIRGAARGMKVTGSYWHLKGFAISHAPDNGIKCEGHHNTFEQIVFHHNGDTGIQIGLNKEDYTTNPEPDVRAAHNLVLNCDSYRNADPATSYENADGFACKLYAGKGNKFFGCRAWENCDDGWDCYQTEHEIVIERCWSWHNGDPSLWGFSSFNGDGNGFKLGGDNTFCPITVLNCVALEAQWGTTVGFAFNNNTAPITLYNCSALHCGRSYKFGQNGNIFKNCLDWNSTRPAPVDITGTSTQVNNSWNLTVTVTAADFVSVSENDAAAPRQADGSLPNNGFARLVSGSDLIDKGVDVGIPFNGAAPDLGAYEYAP